MSRIYGNIGFSGLWNGLPVRIVMIGTLTGFQWLMYVSPSPSYPSKRDLEKNGMLTNMLHSYDSFKVYLGLPTTGGH